jgi:hypothetical protein
LIALILSILGGLEKWHNFLKYLGSYFNCLSKVISSLTWLRWTQKITQAATPLVTGNE